MKNSLNKRQLIRVYNKNLDIIQKKKISLYQDYLIENDITRIELEVRQELAKIRSYYDVFDNYILIGIFKNYLYKYTKIFDSIEGEKITLYKSKDIKLDSEEYQSIYYKNYKKGIFLGHAKTIYNMGFCPVRVLIGEGYIQDKTKYLLGADNIADLHNKEIELKQKLKDDKYFRENVDEILNNLYKYGKV